MGGGSLFLIVPVISRIRDTHLNSGLYYLPMNCPDCGAAAQKAIYMGIPMYLCDLCQPDGEALVFGPLAFLMCYLPFNGVFFIYHGMGYFKAMLFWLSGAADDD